MIDHPEQTLKRLAEPAGLRDRTESTIDDVQAVVADQRVGASPPEDRLAAEPRDPVGRALPAKWYDRDRYLHLLAQRPDELGVVGDDAEPVARRCHQLLP